MRIALLGDVMLGRRVGERLAEDGPRRPWGDVLPWLADADLVVANLECVLARSGSPWAPGEKECHFRADPEHVAVLREGRVAAVSLANNHAMDYGPESLLETIGVLDAAGIAHAGAGRDEEEAWRPARLDVAGRRVALVAFTDQERPWAARKGRPGTAACRTELRDARCQRLLATVREARRSADVVVVSAHWGGNWGSVPDPRHPPLARALVESGADVVHGHSPHVLRGVGAHRGRPVLYGCGGLVDDYRGDPRGRHDRSAVWSVDLVDGRAPVVRARPISIGDRRATLASPDEAREVGCALVALSSALGATARYDRARSEAVVTP